MRAHRQAAIAHHRLALTPPHCHTVCVSSPRSLRAHFAGCEILACNSRYHRCMRTKDSLLIAALASVAIGVAPRSALAGTGTACVRGNMLNHIDRTKHVLVMCDTEDKCDAVDLATLQISPGKARVYDEANKVPERSTSKPSGEVCEERPRNGATAARCAKLGARALQARLDGASAPFAISDNGKFVAVGGRLWNLKSDKEVKIRPWAKGQEFAAEGGMNVSVVAFVGDTAVASMTPCAGPCTESRLFSTAGKALSKKSFPGVTDLVQLNPTTYFGLGQQGQLVRITAPSNKIAVIGKEGELAETGYEAILNGAPTVVFPSDNALVIKTFSADASALVGIKTLPFCNP